MRISRLQLDLKKKLEKISKTMLKNYEYTKGIDSYLTMKRNMSVEDKAKYYKMSEVLDSVYKTTATPEEVENIVRSFKTSEFNRQVKALANNRSFRNCMNQHREDGKAFSKWKEISKDVIKVKTGPAIKA